MRKDNHSESVGAGAAAVRRAKIICTVGPSCNSEGLLRDLMRVGMDVARLNFSHGTHEEHGRVIERLRRAAEKEDRTICILQDLQGPKIRTGELKGHSHVTLKAGSKVTHHSARNSGHGCPDFHDISGTGKGSSARARAFCLSDGLIELRVSRVRGSDVECEVINGGLLGEHKGINLPGIALSIPALD